MRTIQLVFKDDKQLHDLRNKLWMTNSPFMYFSNIDDHNLEATVIENTQILKKDSRLKILFKTFENVEEDITHYNVDSLDEITHIIEAHLSHKVLYYRSLNNGELTNITALRGSKEMIGVSKILSVYDVCEINIVLQENDKIDEIFERRLRTRLMVCKNCFKFSNDVVVEKLLNQKEFIEKYINENY